jgi:hypothetical protein
VSERERWRGPNARLLDLGRVEVGDLTLQRLTTRPGPLQHVLIQRSGAWGGPWWPHIASASSALGRVPACLIAEEGERVEIRRAVGWQRPAGCATAVPMWCVHMSISETETDLKIDAADRPSSQPAANPYIACSRARDRDLRTACKRWQPSELRCGHI